MGVYSFDGGSLWTNEGPEDKTPGYYLERHDTSRDEPIELDVNDPEYQEQIGPAVKALKIRSFGFNEKDIRRSWEENLNSPE